MDVNFYLLMRIPMRIICSEFRSREFFLRGDGMEKNVSPMTFWSGDQGSVLRPGISCNTPSKPHNII